MIDIIIKIVGLGIGNEAQGSLFLTDYENKQFYKEKTYDGMVKFSLKANCLYKLIIISCQGRRVISFYVDRKRKCYRFNIFDNIFTRKIIFQLTDANYKDLPIEKGEIILWQK